MTGKKHTSATVERSVLKLVFLNFLSSRKDCYKPQQYRLKPPTENDTISFRESVSFIWKHFFRKTFKNTEVF